MPTVLVVDDDAALCELYRQELEYYGYSVITASNGAEAVEQVQRAPVDVVVLDIAMPGLDGIDTLTRILAVQNRLPVILNTAYACYQDDFMTWAAEAYVVKSHDLSELVQAVRDALIKRGITPPEPPAGQ